MALRPRTRLWIEDAKGEIVFGSGRVRILEAIDETGSMNKAAKELRMSYRTLWGKIHDTEKRLGFKLIKTSVGGSAAGGSRLTPKAREMLRQYDKWQDKTLEFADKLFAKLYERKYRKRRKK
jgi:molybdate transport system regulatory protein